MELAMDTQRIKNLLSQLESDSNADAAIRAGHELELALGSEMPSWLLKKYRESKKSEPRYWCVYFSIPYARVSRDAFLLGIEALSDRSRRVRHSGCLLLAYSLNEEALPFLTQLCAHKDEKSSNDAKAAIDAILNKNHNYFVDRNHSGNITLTIDPISNISQ